MNDHRDHWERLRASLIGSERKPVTKQQANDTFWYVCVPLVVIGVVTALAIIITG